MIIQAAQRFVCNHRWVATATGDRWVLVCEGCGHRTEQLPLTKLDREMASRELGEHKDMQTAVAMFR